MFFESLIAPIRLEYLKYAALGGSGQRCFPRPQGVPGPPGPGGGGRGDFFGLPGAPRRARPDEWPDAVIGFLLPNGAGERTQAIVTSAAAKSDARPGATLRHLVGLTLGSPEFQLQ